MRPYYLQLENKNIIHEYFFEYDAFTDSVCNKHSLKLKIIFVNKVFSHWMFLGDQSGGVTFTDSDVRLQRMVISKISELEKEINETNNSSS